VAQEWYKQGGWTVFLPVKRPLESPNLLSKFTAS
jgi:hypothetical protein